MPVPKIPPKGSRPIRRGEGVADPRYLLAKIEELKVIAEKGGFRTLAYALEVAAMAGSAGRVGGARPCLTFLASRAAADATAVDPDFRQAASAVTAGRDCSRLEQACRSTVL
jgi:hypothetical protein